MEFSTTTILSILIGIITTVLILICIKFQKIKKEYIHNYKILIIKEKEIKIIKEKFRKNIDKIITKNNIQLEKTLHKLKNELKEKELIQEKLFNEKTSGFPYVAEHYARYYEHIRDLYSEYLSHIANQNNKQITIINDLIVKLKKIEKSYFKCQGILDYYEHSFPWLRETLGVSDEKIGVYPPSLQEIINNEWKNIREKYRHLQEEKKAFEEHKEHTISIIKEKENEIIRKEKDLSEKIIIFEKIFKEKTIGFPWLASQYAKLKKVEFEVAETCLRTKSQPAIKAANILKEYGEKVREAERNSFICQCIVEYYETLFPWLSDFKNVPDKYIIQKSEFDTNNEDPAYNFLSRSEWSNLSQSEKFQKALDRYRCRKKTNWEVGRDFERFIGYEYECNGWDVTFHGAIKGFEDMGRDLIVKKGNSIKIIQCKYWAKEKVIHEKHIFQLFGTCVSYAINMGLLKKQVSLMEQPTVEGVFITSCSLSKTAQKVASVLGIKFIEFKKLENYPCIKCNIGRGGEKIYHLPFDKSYDKIKIEHNKGEFYCETIENAESAGFRRAHRWYGASS